MKIRSLLEIIVLDISFIIVMIPESEVPEGLINFSISRDSQGLFCSFNFMKFTSDVFFDILKVF